MTIKDIKIINKMLESNDEAEFYEYFDYFIYKTLYYLKQEERDRDNFADFLEQLLIEKIKTKEVCGHKVGEIFFTLIVLLRSVDRDKKQVRKDVMDVWERV